MIRVVCLVKFVYTDTQKKKKKNPYDGKNNTHFVSF